MTTRELKAAFNLKRLKELEAEKLISTNVVVERDAKTGRVKKSFEALGDCERLVDGRLACLLHRVEGGNSTPDHEAAILALTLGSSSLVNPLFMRELRDLFLSHAVSLILEYDKAEVTYFTLVSANWRFHISELAEFSARKLLEAVRVELYRLGLAALDGWLIVGVHGEVYRDGTVQPHLHLVACGDKRKAVEALRGLDMFKGGRGRPVYAPIQAKPVGNVWRQTAYLLQGFWPLKRGGYCLPAGRPEHRKKRRLPDDVHADWLAWLNRQQFSDLVWLHGVLIRDGELKAIVN